MNKLLIQRLDKIYDDIVKNYVHDDKIDEAISDILKMIDELQNKIKWTL
jgi:hypothetical protein